MKGRRKARSGEKAREKAREEQGEGVPSRRYHCVCRTTYHSLYIITQQTFLELLPSGHWIPWLSRSTVSFDISSLAHNVTFDHFFNSPSFHQPKQNQPTLILLFWHRLLHEWIHLFFLEVIAKNFPCFCLPAGLIPTWAFFFLSLGRFQPYHQPSKSSWIKELSS